MAFDRVRVLKIEKPSTGGTQTDVYPTDININEDAVDARGVVLQNDSSNDETVIISRDAAGNMTFDDAANSIKTLTELSAAGSDDDQVKDNVPVGQTFTVKDEHQHLTYDEFTVAGEYIVEGEAVVLGGYEESGGGGMVNHALGGAYHTASTLAQINALVSDATLDTSSASRTPSAHKASHENGGTDEMSVAGLSGELADDQPVKAHDLAGAKHNSATLAELNAKVSDATLDTASASRTPSAHKASHEDGGADEISIAGLSGQLADNQPALAHGLAGAKHNIATLSELNAKISDATLDTSSDSRPPTTVVFSGHNNAGGGTIEGTWVDVAIDAEHKKTSGFTHSTSSDPAEVTIVSAGTYRIDAQVTTGISSGTNRSQSEIRLALDTGSGFAAIDGTLGRIYNRTLAQAEGSAGISYVNDFDAGDVVKLQVIRSSSTSTITLVADGSRLVIQKI